MTERRFPLPWSVEDIGVVFVLKDGSGQRLAYVYFEEEPGRRSAAKLHSKGEARQSGEYRAVARVPRFQAEVRNDKRIVALINRPVQASRQPIARTAPVASDRSTASP